MKRKKLLYNGKVFTFSENESVAEAVLVIDNKITRVGRYQDLIADIDDSTIKIDLKGKAVLPAFVDAHTHFMGVSKLQRKIDLSSAKSVQEIENIFANYQVAEDAKWIEGHGWDLNRYPDAERFNINLLDKYFNKIPVSLISHDHHTNLCNSKALNMMGIDKNTPNPHGGSFGKFADGKLNGFLYEKAWILLDEAIPPLEKSVKKDLVQDEIARCWIYGLAGVNVMETLDDFEIFDSIDFEKFPFRFYYHFPSAKLDDIIKENINFYGTNEQHKYCGMKIFMDGALGSHTALMFDSYPNEPENYGTAIYSKEELYALVKKAAINGIASTIHAIGDKANDNVVDIFAKVNAEVGWLPHRVEHFQCARNELFTKVVKNKIICSVQPIHQKEDIPNIKKIWSDREKFTYSFKDEIDAGICLAFGSDAPIETINPFVGVYAALQRKADNNPDNPSWRPEQKISVWDAIKGYTVNAALSSNSFERRGSIEEGKLADLIVLDDFTQLTDEYWLTAESLLTMVDGKIVLNKLD